MGRYNTTNTVEGLHRQIRKVIKTKGAFPNDLSLLKLAYFAIKRVCTKWNKLMNNWGPVAQQLAIKFGGRMLLALTLNAALDRKVFTLPQ